MNWADFLHADCDAINFGYTTLYSIFLTFKSTVVVLVRPLQGPKDYNKNAIKNYIKNTKNSVCHAPYLRDHTSYDCHLWYTCVKW